MLPAERRHVRDNRRCDIDALPLKFNKLDVHHVIPDISRASNVINPPHAGILFQWRHLLKWLAITSQFPVPPQFRIVEINPLSDQPQGRLRTQIAQENIPAEIDLCLVSLIPWGEGGFAINPISDDFELCEVSLTSSHTNGTTPP